MATTKSELDDKLHWYKDAIIYELHIKAFFDSNGDGIGDFQGLIEKLDYLEELGVTAIWVLPFYPSPLRDDGYDIADYYRINPSYGNILQFKKFLREAHKRNLKVITELVINHTSDQHPWFQRARRAPKGSVERDYYVWTDDPSQYNEVRIIFQDFEASNWTWDPLAQQYYWHRFFHHQPDLNFDNPKVQEEVFKIIDFWAQMGVDGFRLDAVPYLFEREGTNCENLPETHAFLKKLRAHVDTHYPGTLLLAEANMWPEDSAAYFGDGDECHMNYHFPVMPRMFMALRMEDRYPILDIYDQTPKIPDTCQWAIFLRNHDELTLEMVTDEERDYMYKVYAKDPKAKINLGIRHRLSPLMDNNRKKIELLNYLLFSLPGTPVIYYGDEIGMGDNFYLGDRDGVRTPMQWSSNRNAGFSEANPQMLYLPVILDPEFSYEAVNVETQRRNTSSLLWWMKRVINMRKRYKAFGRGDLTFVNAENPKVMAFIRSYDDETILVVVNLSRFTQAAELDLGQYKGYVPLELFSKNKFPEIKEDAPYFFTLSPHAYHWFLLQKAHKQNEDNEQLPFIKLNKWDDLFDSQTEFKLENEVLPRYMLASRWFGGKARTIQTMEIADKTEVVFGANRCWFLLVRVNYENGMPDIYQLPITFLKEKSREDLKESQYNAVLARMDLNGEHGWLYDALFCKDLQQYILKHMVSRQGKSKNGTIRMHGNNALKTYLKQHDEIKSKVLSVEQSNTSIIYDNAFFLKIYRKVDQAINPDLEINRFLKEEAQFDFIPDLVGAIEWEHGKSNMVLGMMQKMVANHGDAWSYMLDRLGAYYERILSKQEDFFQVPELMGSSTKPMTFDAMPVALSELLGPITTERTRLLGERTGEMHLALASNKVLPDFKPEPFSLHYQRSLYSSLQSLVRGTYQNLGKKIKTLSPELRQEAEEVYAMKDDVLKAMKRIYSKKLEVVKIRNHGDYHLGQVLFTGKDFVLLDFEGEPARSFSERRLKRSPLRDVAGMIRSYHYAAYSGLLLHDNYREEDLKTLLPWAEFWFHHISGFFMHAYLTKVKGSAFIPKEEEDLEVMLRTFLLEKAIYELNYELNNRPDWLMIPLKGIKSLMEKSKTLEVV